MPDVRNLHNVWFEVQNEFSACFLYASLTGIVLSTHESEVGLFAARREDPAISICYFHCPSRFSTPTKRALFFFYGNEPLVEGKRYDLSFTSWLVNVQNIWSAIFYVISSRLYFLYEFRKSIFFPPFNCMVLFFCSYRRYTRNLGEVDVLILGVNFLQIHFKGN